MEQTIKLNSYEHEIFCTILHTTEEGTSSTRISDTIRTWSSSQLGGWFLVPFTNVRLSRSSQYGA